MFQTSGVVFRVEFKKMRAFAFVITVEREKTEVRTGGVEARIRRGRLTRRMEDLDIEGLRSGGGPDDMHVGSVPFVGAEQPVHVPIGPIDVIPVQRNGKGMHEIIVAAEDFVVIVTKVVDGVNRVGPGVDPIETPVIVVEGEAVGPASFRHILADVEDDSASGA